MAQRPNELPRDYITIVNILHFYRILLLRWAESISNIAALGTLCFNVRRRRIRRNPRRYAAGLEGGFICHRPLWDDDIRLYAISYIRWRYIGPL